MSRDSILITAQSQALPEDSQPPDEGQKVTLVPTPVAEETMLSEQLQYILSLYSEGLFGDGPEEQPAAEQMPDPEPDMLLLCLL